MALKLFSRQKEATTTPPRPPSSPPPATAPKRAPFEPAPVEVYPDDPLLTMLQMERHAVLAHDRDVVSQHVDGAQILKEAIEALEDRLALVPNGVVTVPKTLSAQPGDDEADVDVKPFLLAIHAITNAQFQRFVDAGGYEDLKLWPEDIWPHLIELHDQTDRPGPRYWRDGRHDRRQSDHPVVGISWYEARAFAQWIGQRLPTEAEWQMAASWHIKSSADILRRFPWGDAMDATRCNIWLSGLATTCPVDAYPEGAAPNRVMQLVGNVWEWTSTEFAIVDDEGSDVFGEMPMYTIRGAAFDTYFESQATAEFRTGQISLARAHNVGFRCALDLAQASWLND